jgi:hypothetical protein
MENSIIMGWSDFLVATAGATGALAGLVFVAISINLARIIERPGITGRAAETLILLSGTLAGSLAVLMPHLTEKELGYILLCISVPTWMLPNVIVALAVKRKTHYHPLDALLRAFLHQAAALPGVLTGLSFLGMLPGGLIWFGGGAILSILVAMFNAWVLLIEILR